MKCKLCGDTITKHGFSELLNNSESKRLAGIKSDESVCLDCKTTMLILGVLSPWQSNASADSQSI